MSRASDLASGGSVASSVDEGDYNEIDPGDLEIGESVGTGATAEVWKGFWQGKQVAIKDIYLQRKGTAELKQKVAFTREVAVMSKVNHPCLVKFWGVSLKANQLRVVTEFCEGDTLFSLLHGDNGIDLTWAQKLKMCQDIASGMDYLHAFRPQIIHRDLKSLNLLLAKKVKSNKDTPIVKISDFGLARMKDADGGQWEKMTKDAGTLHWMAPEVPTGKYTEKVDVYSYAMVLFEIVCEEVPFEDVDGKEALKATVAGKRPDMEAAAPPDAPPPLLNLTKQCWDQDPVKRPSFAMASEFLKGIKM